MAEKVRIYHRSWRLLCEAFDLAIPQFGNKRNLEHWESIGSEVRELARKAGQYQ